MKETIYSGLKQLGGGTQLPTRPKEALLERVQNPSSDVTYCVRLVVPHLTSLSPMTGRPDFARLVIDYVPGNWLVESKSLKFITDRSAIMGRLMKTAPSLSRADCKIFWRRNGFASEGIGIRAVESRLMYSGRPARCRRASGCRIKACHRIADAADTAAVQLRQAGHEPPACPDVWFLPWGWDDRERRENCVTCQRCRAPGISGAAPGRSAEEDPQGCQRAD